MYSRSSSVTLIASLYTTFQLPMIYPNHPGFSGIFREVTERYCHKCSLLSLHLTTATYPRGFFNPSLFQSLLYLCQLVFLSRNLSLPLSVIDVGGCFRLFISCNVISFCSRFPPYFWCADILVPYNLATYVFHQLVGTRQTSFVVTRLADPSALLTLPSVSEANVVNTSVAEPTTGSAPNVTNTNTTNNNNSADGSTGRTSSCPVLATGAILDGSGLPLVVSNYLTEQYEVDSDELERKKDSCTRRLGGTQSVYLHQVDLAQLEDAVLADAELGLSAVLSVLGVRSRVPEANYTYFVEGQWAQLNALTVYVLRHYRDELAKLDRVRFVYGRLITLYFHFFINPMLSSWYAALDVGCFYYTFFRFM